MYYQTEARFNGVFLRNNLPKKIKDGAYVINLDEYADIDTHWIALFCNRDEIVYFDSFGVEHIPDEIKKFIGNKNIKAKFFRGQANSSIMCGYFYIGFIEFMLAGNKLTDYTSLFSHYDFNKNDNRILDLFQKMNESNSIDGIDKTNLTNETKFRLDKLRKLKAILLKRLIKEKHVVKI